MIVDVHAHLDLFKDIDQVIENAKKAEVKRIIAAGIDKKSNRKVLDLSKRYEIVLASMGIYPVNALKREMEAEEFPIDDLDFSTRDELEFIRSNADNIVAIGEVGLDYNDKNITEQEKQEQKQLFEEQIELAKELDKPLVVHSRKAEQDVIELLEKHDAKNVVMHCFSGKFKLAKKIVENGWYLSIPANVVRSEIFQNFVSNLPLSNLLTETDSPYLSPFKDTINEPANIVQTIKKISEIKKMEKTEVENIIFMNFQRLF